MAREVETLESSSLNTLFAIIQLRNPILGDINEGGMTATIKFSINCATTLESLALALTPNTDGEAEGMFNLLSCLPRQ